MPVEIERKFLLSSEAWRAEAARSERMVQGYLSDGGPNTLRVRIAGTAAFLTIKGKGQGISRSEYEYPIPLAEAEELLALCVLPLVEKQRHYVSVGSALFEIDEFSGENQGLIVAEIELDAEDEDFPRPSWLGEEVSHDPRYRNVALARTPFSRFEKVSSPEAEG